MSPVPAYDRLGYKVKDLFEQHFHIGKIHLNINNTITHNVAIQLKDGEMKLEHSKLTGNVSALFNVPRVSVQALAKMNNEEEFFTEVHVYDKTVMPGFKALFATKIKKQNDLKQTGYIEAAHEGYYHNVSTRVHFPGYALSNSSVFKYADCVLACAGEIDPRSLKVSKHELSLGFDRSNNLALIASCKELKEYKLAIYKQINDQLEKGLLIQLNDKKEVTLSVALAAALSPQSTIKAKMNNAGEIGLAYTHLVTAGVKLSFSTLCETKQLMWGGHKLGFGIELER